jgi:phage major head subunit gpT-like protein
MSFALRSQYTDLYGSSMLPVLEELFKSSLERHPSRREMLFKTVPTDRDIWQSSELHDMELFNEIGEGAEYTYKRAKQGAAKTLTIKKMGLGFSITEEMIDDGKFNLVADMTEKLAKSAAESQEVDAMNIFNNGFSSETTADGVSVFNSAHTLPSGGTFRNVLSTAADLSVDSFETALTDYETQFVGDSGIIYRLKPRILLVAPGNRRYAQELVGSDGKPDSADNNMNSFKNEGIMVVSSPHLTDTDAWFLIGDKADTGLRIVSRRGIQTKSENVFDTDSIKYKASYREKIGCTHAYGVFGTAGA